MFDARRPLGWLFLLLLVALAVSAQTLPTTMISDIVYRADGTPAGGTLLISWPEFTTAAGGAVAAGNTAVTLGAGGALSVGLVPNANATPANTVYTVVYQLDDGTVKTEYWVVPTTSPTTISAVRTTLGAGNSASQMATEQYVNAALAGKANDASVVHLSGAETIVGAKQFSVAPALPTPVLPTDAANKLYVDNSVQNVGNGSYLSTAGGTMTGPLTLSGDPVTPGQAATKRYADVEFAQKADLVAGMVPSGELGTGTANNTLCLHGDSTWGGCGSSSNAVSIQNVPVDTTAPTDNQVITYVASLGKYEPKPGGGVTAGMQAVKYATDFSWSQLPATDLSTPGVKTVNLATCAAGVTGTEPWYYVYISGTGTAEAVLVTGGSCTGNGQAGTLQFTTLNAHPAGYTIASASGGLQEALIVARFTPTNPAGPSQSGKVIVPPGELQAYARISIRASNVTVDFSGSIVDCYMADTCIFAGDPSNATGFLDITLVNPRGRPMMVSGQSPFIEVNGQKTRLLNVSTRIPPTGGTFSSYVQVDNDQSFLLDGLDTALATGSSEYGVLCNASVCNPVIYAPGPFSVNAAVGWLKNLNISMQCTGNGIDWQSGNSVRISDSVIEGFAQYGVRAGVKRGGYGGFELDNVYEEVGSCTNPAGAIGQAGVIAQGATVKVEGAVSPVGSIPLFANTGSTDYRYYIVANSATLGGSNPLYAGRALTNGSGNITVTTPDVAGASTFDLLRVTYVNFDDPREQAPYGTGDYAVAHNVTRASACANGVCTFTDTQAALQSYTVAAPAYFPLLDYWPGNLILATNHDSASVLDAATAWVDSAPSDIVGVQGAGAPAVISTNCNALTGWTPLWLSCYTSMSAGTFYTQGALLMAVKPNQDGGFYTNLKGRLNFPTLGTGPGHIITLSDSNFQKTIATANNRPSNDANDAFIGYDQGNGNPATVGISLGAPVSISNYIGNVGDGANWLERLTSGGKEFKTSVQMDSALTVAGTAQASSLLTTGTGSWAVQGSYGSLSPAAAGKSGIGFGASGKLQVSENGGTVVEVAKLDSNGDVSENANTATQLAQAPTQCNGSFATGVQANGNANCSTADVVQLAETTPPIGIPNYGIFWFDSTCHCPKVISNNGQAVQLGLLNVFNLDANTLEEYNGANPQTLNMYGTRADASDYERMRLGYDTTDNYFLVSAEASGTAFLPPGLGFWLEGSLRWVIDPSFNFKPWSDNVKDVGSPTLRLKHLYTGTYVDTTAGAVATDLPNAATTGTTLNKLAKVTGSPATAIIASTSDTGGVVGIVVDGAGTTLSAQIARGGQASCVFDGATTAGDYVQISSTTDGDCHDAGAGYPGIGQVLGRVLSTNASAGTYAMLVAGAEIQAPATGAVSTVFGRAGTIIAQAGDYSVGQVTGAAALASPSFTGTPTAPTQVTADNSTKIATTAWVNNQGYAAGLTATGGPVANQFPFFTSATNLGAETIPLGQTLVGNGGVAPPLFSLNPIQSVGFSPAVNAIYDDRCAAIHACTVQCVSGNCGGVCSALGEIANPSMECESDPLPSAADGNNNGTLYLPAGLIKLPFSANFNPQNSAELWGTAVGNNNASGPTGFAPGSSWTPGSGANFAPALFSWGQPLSQTGTLNSAGIFGPYNTHAGLLQLGCVGAPNTFGMSVMSGQDDTKMFGIGINDCVVGIVAGSRATQNGTAIEGVYLVHSNASSGIANDPNAGGGATPWTIQNWSIAGTGSSAPGVMILAVSGGACGSGGNSSCSPFPGLDAFIGLDSGISNSGTCTGSGCLATPASGTHFTGSQISGDYTIGAVADMMNVTTWSATGTGAANAIPFTLNGTNDFPQDALATCSSSYNAINCSGNGLVYLSGCTDTTYNGGILTVYSASGSSVTGWLNKAITSGHTSGTTCNAAYSNSIDPWTFAGTPFTASGQFAVNTNLLVSGGDSSNTAQGTLITYGNTVDINSVSGFRPWRQFTLTNTKLLESLHSEYPAHDMNINGWGFTLEHSHLESTKLEAITIGKDAPTSNIGLDDLWINSNIGWTQNGAASTGISAGATGNNHSCAIRIFSRYGEPTGIRISHIDEQGAAPAIGSNQPANVLCDDGNNNIITVAACPHLGYYNLDGSGSATTDCPANSIQNGMAFNDGTITVRSGGATVMQISATGAALVSAALTGTPTAPTQASSDNSTSLATDAFVKNQAYATLASPTFTGTPVVPGYAKTGTLVSGNYASATGTGTVGDSTIVAGPYNSVWSLPGSVSTTTPVACSGSANKVTVWGLALSYPLKTSNIAYYVQGTDNTANTYDIGIYSTSGAQIVHTGSLAGTSFAPSTGYKAQAWTAANTVIQPGNYYIALTCSATSGTATFGYTFTWASAANTVESLSSGSGGTLPATQTVPSAIAMTNASTIQFAVY